MSRQQDKNWNPTPGKHLGTPLKTTARAPTEARSLLLLCPIHGFVPEKWGFCWGFSMNFYLGALAKSIAIMCFSDCRGQLRWGLFACSVVGGGNERSRYRFGDRHEGIQRIGADGLFLSGGPVDEDLAGLFLRQHSEVQPWQMC